MLSRFTISDHKYINLNIICMFILKTKYGYDDGTDTAIAFILTEKVHAYT